MPSSKTLIRRDTAFISNNMHKKSLIKAMRLHGLTATKVIKPIVEALTATKTVVRGAGSNDAFIDVEPDHATRLRAVAMAIDLLQLTKDITPDDTGAGSNPIEQANKVITDAIQAGDEVELQRVLFNKKSSDAQGVLEVGQQKTRTNAKK